MLCFILFLLLTLFSPPSEFQISKVSIRLRGCQFNNINQKRSKNAAANEDDTLSNENFHRKNLKLIIKLKSILLMKLISSPLHLCKWL